MITFLFQSAIVWAASLVLYYIILRKTTFFALNRWYLLSTLLFGLGATYLGNLIMPWTSPDTKAIIYGMLPEIHIGTKPLAIENPSYTWLWSLYFIGLAFFVVRMVYGLYTIRLLHQGGIKEEYGAYVIIRNEKVRTPFSFFRWIFLSTQTTDFQSLQPIIEHEKMHIRMGHSFDLLCLEVLNCIFWFQPLLRFYKKALKETHEYLADQEVSKSFSLESYVKMLISPYTEWKESGFVSPFYQSQIKNRIQMLNHNRSDRKQLLFYLLSPLMLGILALVFSSFSAPDKAVKKNYWIATDTIPAPKPMMPPPPPPPPSKRSSTDKPIAPPPPPPPPSVLSGVTVVAQGAAAVEMAPAPPPPPPPPPPAKRGKDGKLISVDQADELPRFPGCEGSGSLEEKNQCSNQKMMSFVSKEMKYPEKARKNKTQGRCIAKFTVNKEGYIENIVIEEDPGDGTGDEVARILSKMNQLPERWVPGKKDGKAVAAEMTLPVNFWLDK